MLTVELPVENLDENEFKDALDALSDYADRHYLDVLTLATAGAEAHLTGVTSALANSIALGQPSRHTVCAT